MARVNAATAAQNAKRWFDEIGPLLGRLDCRWAAEWRHESAREYGCVIEGASVKSGFSQFRIVRMMSSGQRNFWLTVEIDGRRYRVVALRDRIEMRRVRKPARPKTRWPELRRSDVPTGYGPSMSTTVADLGYDEFEDDSIRVAAAIRLCDSGDGTATLEAAIDRLEKAARNADDCNTDTMDEMIAAESVVLAEFLAVAPQEWQPRSSEPRIAT